MGGRALRVAPLSSARRWGYAALGAGALWLIALEPPIPFPAWVQVLVAAAIAAALLGHGSGRR